MAVAFATGRFFSGLRPYNPWLLHGAILLVQAIIVARVLPHGSGWGALVLHACVVAGLVGVEMLVWNIPGLPARVIATGRILLATLVQFILLVAYIGNMLSGVYLRTPLNLHMMATYLNHLGHVSRSAGFQPIWPILALVLLLLILLGINLAIFGRRAAQRPGVLLPMLGIAASAALYFGLPNPYREHEFLYRTLYALPVEVAPEGLLAFRQPDVRPTYATPEAAIDPRPLILISINSLRADAMQVYGNPTQNTPFLQSLMDGDTLHLYRNTNSVCTSSYCGIVGLVSSRYWRDLNHSPDTLMDALAYYGYRNHALLSGDHSRYYGLSRQYGENIPFYRDGTSSPHDYPNDDRLVHRWLNELPTEEGDSQFYWFHLMDVHSLGLRYVARHEAIRGRAREITIRDPALLARMEEQGEQLRDFAQRYHNGISQADETIRAVFAWLEAEGMLDTALVIITADHGELLGESGATGHGSLPWSPRTQVPLMIYDPLDGSWPQFDITSTVDVGPTLLAAIGAPVPSHWSGVPLQRPSTRCAVRSASRQGEVLIGAVDGSERRIWTATDGAVAEMPLIEQPDWQAGGDQESPCCAS